MVVNYDLGKNTIGLLGGKLVEIKPSGDKNSGHVLVIVEKLVETPRVFPRKPGEAKRSPVK